MVVLARVDQRRIHGLVVNQWAPALQVKKFMVVDDVLYTMKISKQVCEWQNRQEREFRSSAQRRRSQNSKPESMTGREF